jgi:prepilin-type N-terminal cleavage/methylation domain-containing protein
MIFGRLRVIQRDQKGFTLIELLVVVAITGLITWGITMTIFQVFNTNTRNSSHMIAIRQVQNAGSWVSPDVQMAQSVNATGGQGFPLTLTWIEWETGDSHAVNYTLEDNTLQRSYSVNGGDPTVTTVAEYIDPDPDQTSCYPLGVLPPGAVLTFTVTATVGGESETRVYEVKPRPS